MERRLPESDPQAARDAAAHARGALSYAAAAILAAARREAFGTPSLSEEAAQARIWAKCDRHAIGMSETLLAAIRAL